MGLNKDGLHIGAVAYKKFDLNGQSSKNLMQLLDKLGKLPASLAFEELISKILEMGRHIMEAEASNLLLLKADSGIGILYSSSIAGMFKKEIRLKELSMEESYGGWVIQHRIPLIDNRAEQGQASLFDKLDLSFKIKNLICAPLIMIGDENDLMGTMQVVNRHHAEDFRQEDLAIFQVLANHAAKELARNRTNEQRNEHLAQKDLFLSELHHRMKNNLSFISGIVELEKSKVKDLTTKNVLKKIQTRLDSVNIIYELLSGRGEFSDVELGPYIKKITTSISEALSTPVRDIRMEVRVDKIVVNPEQALSCGLILNELLVNGFKHAFKYRKEGRLYVDLSNNDGQILLIYRDNGIGIPQDIDVDKSDSLGLKIIKSFTHKLNGTYSFSQTEEHDGTQFALMFPVKTL